MVKVKGTAVYPSALADAVMAFGEVGNFRFVVEKDGDLDAMVLEVETLKPGEALGERLARVVKSVSNITPEVRFVARGSLSGERKTKHFVDNRK